jgi:hypothetical protein
LRYDNQIIVNPDLGPPAKPARLNPQSAKLAAAAGVKPASLLTRIPPGERQIPKPAFELTQKKLDAAGTETATKKVTVKAKPAKIVPTTAKVEITKRPASGKSGKSKKPARGASPRATSLAKKSAHPPRTGGPKPSPAIAKTQGNEQPSDE